MKRLAIKLISAGLVIHQWFKHRVICCARLLVVGRIIARYLWASMDFYHFTMNIHVKSNILPEWASNMYTHEIFMLHLFLLNLFTYRIRPN